MAEMSNMPTKTAKSNQSRYCSIAATIFDSKPKVTIPLPYSVVCSLQNAIDIYRRDKLQKIIIAAILIRPYIPIGTFKTLRYVTVCYGIYNVV